MKKRFIQFAWLLFISLTTHALTIDEFIDQLDQFDSEQNELSYIESQSIHLNNWSQEAIGRYYFHLGYAQERNNLIELALINYNKSVEILSVKQNGHLVRALIERSYVKYIQTKDVNQYCPDRKQALQIARSLEEPNLLIRALTQYAFCFENDRQKFREGLSFLDEAFELAIEYKLSNNHTAMIHNATAVLYRKNQIHTKAYEYFLKAYRSWDSINDVKDMFNMQHALLGESLALGEWQTATKHVDQIMELAEENPEHQDFYFFAYFNKARFALAQNDFSLAIEAFEKALELRNTTKETFFINQTKLSLAICYFRSNEIIKAQKYAVQYLDSQAIIDESSESVITSQAIIDIYNGKTIDAIHKVWSLVDKEKQSRLDFIKDSVKDQTIYFEQNLTEFQNQALEQQLSINTLQLKNEQDKNRINKLTNIIFALVIFMFVAAIIYLINSRKYFKKHAQQDFLTGLNNRRFTFLKGHKIIEDSNKFQRPASLILFDIDNFKSINDQYGHDAGDKVLQQLADIVKRLTTNQILGRIGGEEFLVILANENIDQAIKFAETIRSEIAAAKIQTNSHELTVTVSLGVSCNSHFKAHLDLLVKQADLALYQAKQNGRNQVQVYQS